MVLDTNSRSNHWSNQILLSEQTTFLNSDWNVILDTQDNFTSKTQEVLEISESNENIQPIQIISERGCDVYLDPDKDNNSQVEENEQYITINLLVKIKDNNYKVSLNIDKLKKFSFPSTNDKLNWPDSLRLMLCFTSQYKNILKTGLSKTDKFWLYDNLDKLSYSDSHNKPKSRSNLKLEKQKQNINITINDLNYELDTLNNQISFYFTISWYQFKVENVSYSKKSQNTWDYNEESYIIDFNKQCLNNISINMSSVSKKWPDNWELFRDIYSNYSETRTKISQMIFNQLNSWEVKSDIN